MKHYAFSKKYRKMNSRQTKRVEAVSTFCIAVLTLAVWLGLFMMMFDVWANHPAEQPISGKAHMAAIQNGGEFYDLD